MLEFMSLPFQMKLSKVVALGRYIVIILKLLVVLIFLLLMNYFTGIHKGDKPTINFKVSNFNYIAYSMRTTNVDTKEINIIMLSVLSC